VKLEARMREAVALVVAARGVERRDAAKVRLVVCLLASWRVDRGDVP
jgi:hypothetical protein